MLRLGPIAMSFQCPHCSTNTMRAHNLRTHLMGSRPYGGHELSRAGADALIEAITAGVPSANPLQTPAPANPPRPAPAVPPPGPLLRDGHWRSLELLEDTRGVREALAAYERATGHPVYLRPTERGLTVMSLDPSLTAMVGVGGDSCCITSLRPDPSAVEASTREYRTKIAAMTRDSTEERFVIAQIRRALENGMRFRDDLLFLHQEWRFPNSGKIDLLAIDTTHWQLVVIEAKKSEVDATRERDKKGRTASGQATEYAAQIAVHARECAPFFLRLAAALAAVYRSGEPVQFDPELPPRWEVWWPGGITTGPTVPRPPPRPALALIDAVVTVASDAPWQRVLRNRQSAWRAAKGYPMGQHDGRPIGSRLAMPAAETELWNFLTPGVGKLAKDEYHANLSRVCREQKVYQYPRLFDNLLSSQPLVFNLLGELALDLGRATEVARRLWPDRVATVSRIEFEWSPGRWDRRYLDNGTAADAAIFHTTPHGGTGIVFVETKYHEDLSGSDYATKSRYFDVARASGAFVDDRVESLTRGSLQQLWFDHLLALATRDADGHESVLFMVAYPEINERCRDAVARYREALTSSGAASFQARTLEELVGPIGHAVGERWESAFRARYLDRQVH